MTINKLRALLSKKTEKAHTISVFLVHLKPILAGLDNIELVNYTY